MISSLNNKIANNYFSKNIFLTKQNIEIKQNKNTQELLGYEIDKNGFFDVGLNMAAALPKNFKIYARGLDNLVQKITNHDFKLFSNIDLAKSLNNAFKIFFQLLPKSLLNKENWSQKDLDSIPQFFSFDKKSLSLEKIYKNEDDFNTALNASNHLSPNPKQLSLAFPSWFEKAPNAFVKKSQDIFRSSSVDLGGDLYKNTDGSISAAGAFIAFFAGNSGINSMLEGEVSVAGKLLGYDKKMSQKEVDELNNFVSANPITYSIGGDPGMDFRNIFLLKSQTSDVDEFKTKWLEMKKISEQNKKAANQINENDKKPFTPITSKSQNPHTYKNINISNEILKKLLENNFDLAKKLDLLFGENSKKLDLKI